MGCGCSVSATSGYSSCNAGFGHGSSYSKITVLAGQHTQHCLWIIALKRDKYQDKYHTIDNSKMLTYDWHKTYAPAYKTLNWTTSVTPCTGGCLYPMYGVGTAFGDSLTGANLIITEAIYPTKIVMRSKQWDSLVITYTMDATSVQITREGPDCQPHSSYSQLLDRRVCSMRDLVEAQAQAILAESPLPSEAAVRQLQPVQQQPAPVPMQQQPVPVPVQQQPAPVPIQQQPVPVPIQQQPVPVPMQQQQPAPVQQQPVPAQTLTKFCSSCGAFLDASTQFCGGCGTPAV